MWLRGVQGGAAFVYVALTPLVCAKDCGNVHFKAGRTEQALPSPVTHPRSRTEPAVSVCFI